MRWAAPSKLAGQAEGRGGWLPVGRILGECLYNGRCCLYTRPMEVRCVHCGGEYDLGRVVVTQRYADCSMWHCPHCERLVDDRKDVRVHYVPVTPVHASSLARPRLA